MKDVQQISNDMAYSILELFFEYHRETMSTTRRAYEFIKTKKSCKEHLSSRPWEQCPDSESDSDSDSDTD